MISALELPSSAIFFGSVTDDGHCFSRAFWSFCCYIGELFTAQATAYRLSKNRSMVLYGIGLNVGLNGVVFRLLYIVLAFIKLLNTIHGNSIPDHNLLCFFKGLALKMS